jgi:hypothetical protein
MHRTFALLVLCLLLPIAATALVACFPDFAQRIALLRDSEFIPDDGL